MCQCIEEDCQEEHCGCPPSVGYEDDPGCSRSCACQECHPVRYANVYAVTRHYGGPEEGGWWYDAGEPIGSVAMHPDWSWETVRTFLEALYADRNHGNIGSVLGGTEVRICREIYFAEPWPARRPRYE